MFLLIMLALAFLQGTIFPPVFLEGVALFFFTLYSLYSNFPSVLPAVFVAGIVFDLAQASFLGVSAAIFVSASGMLFLLSDRIPVKHPVFVSLFLVGLNFLRAQALSLEFPVLPTMLAILAGIFLNARAGEDLRGKLRL